MGDPRGGARTPERKPAPVTDLRLRRPARAIGVLAMICVLTGLLAAPAPGFVEAAPAPTWQTNGRVNAIVQVGDVVYLGGRFTEVHDGNGTSLPRSRLAAIDLTTGEPTAWDPSADDEVFSLADYSSFATVPRAITKRTFMSVATSCVGSPSTAMMSAA